MPVPTPAEPRRSRRPARSERRGREGKRRERETKKKKEKKREQHRSQRRRRRPISPLRQENENGGERGGPPSRSRFRLLHPWPALVPSLESSWFLSPNAVLVLFGRFFFFHSFQEGRERERESGETLLRFFFFCFFFIIPSSRRRQPPSSSFLFLRSSSTKTLDKMSNPVVFFDITADGAPLGRIEMTVSRLLLEREKSERVDLFLLLRR